MCNLCVCMCVFILFLTDKEDNSIKPVVAEDKGDDEEGDTEEDGHASDQVNEVVDLLGNGRLSRVQTGSQTSDTSHYL